MEKLPKYICEWYRKGECVISPEGCSGLPDSHCGKYAPRGPICRYCALRAECDAGGCSVRMIYAAETGHCDKYLDPYCRQPDDAEFLEGG